MQTKFSQAIFHRVVLVSALTLCLSLLLTELYIRFFSPTGYITPQILKERGLEFVPVVSKGILQAKAQEGTNSTGARLHVNSKGYRGREFEFEKSPGTIRIVFYGGSSVFDIGVSDPKDWPHRVEAILHQGGFFQVEVINAGVPGLHSIGALENFLTEGYRLKPDYAVMYCSWNDIGYFSYEKSLLRMLPNEIRPVPLYEYQNFFDRWLCEISQLYVRLRYRYFMWNNSIGMEGRNPEGPPTEKINEEMLFQYRLSLETFADVVRNAGAVPVFMTEARLVTSNNSVEEKNKIRYEFQSLSPHSLVRAFEMADKIVLETAAGKKAPVITASSLLTGKDHFFIDHVHLNREGSEALAAYTAKAFAELLKHRSSEARVGQ